MNDEQMTFFLDNDNEYLVLCKAKSSFRCRLALLHAEHMTFFLHNDKEYLVLCKAKSSFRCSLALLHAVKKGH